MEVDNDEKLIFNFLWPYSDCVNLIMSLTLLLIVPITLVPRSGNMLGGTGVIVSGPCFGAQSKCIFDEVEVTGVLVSETLLLCVTPAMKQSGEVPVTVLTSKNLYYSTFFAGKVQLQFLLMSNLPSAHAQGLR